MATQVNNKLTQKTDDGEAKTFSKFLTLPKVQKSLSASFTDKTEMVKFTASISSAVSANPDLQKCDFSTIVSAGLLSNSLGLSLSPSLGFAYIVPFEDKKRSRFVATFILGYRGYIQLAIRSGYYKRLVVQAIKEGELVFSNPIEEEYAFHPLPDEERENAPVIGYYAMFEHINGFVKKMYWNKNKMLTHADRYSKAFTLKGDRYKKPYQDFLDGKVPSNELWRYSSFWYQDFDEMAKKTMIRQLLSKWGIMSIDMQKAYEQDTETIEEQEQEAENDENVIDGFFEDGKELTDETRQ